jgi:predicted PurR-regulated permease PerM
MKLPFSTPSAKARAVEAPVRPGEFTTLKVCGVIVATVLVGFTLWALRRILEPFVLAVFLLIMIDGMARALRHRVKWFPKWAAMPVSIIAILSIVGFAIWLTVGNAGNFAQQGPMYTAKLDTLLAEGADRLGLSATPTVSDLIKQLNPARFAGALMGGLSHFGEGLVFTLIYLGFLLASGRGLAAKMAALFPGEARLREANRVFDRVRHGVESYVWVQTVVGVLITAASAALMAAVGLSHIGFWCLIIFLSNYIPAVGAAVGVLLPALFGLVELDGVWKFLVLVVGLEAVHFVVSHVVQPRMQGQSLNVDPIVVLLALAFWGVLWGIVGAFLSTPLVVIAMVLLAEFKSTRPLAVLLSGDGKPYADLKAQAAEAAR